MEAVIQRQRASYAHFRRLFRAARKLDHIYLNDADKQSFGVAVHPLNLRSDKGATLPGQPQFFEPMQPEVFDRLPGPGFTVRPDPVDIGIIRGLSFALDIHNHLGDEILEEKRLSPDKYSLLCSTRWDTSTFVFTHLDPSDPAQALLYVFLTPLCIQVWRKVACWPW